MPDYKEMYMALFNAVTDSILLLQRAQRGCEEMFISSSGDEPEKDE